MAETPETDGQAPNENAEEVIVDAQEDDADAPMLERRDGSETNRLKRAIFDVPIEVVVSVGRARPLIGDLLTMGRDHLLPLDAKLEDPVELIVKDRVIAKGELIQAPESEGQLAIKLTEVVNISALAE